MRVPIHPASDPFRRVRPVPVGSGVCAVALAGLLGLIDLRGRFGVAGAFNARLWGYMEASPL
ncbi:MAG TPA: hypothetical protein VGG72_36015 [Bryobacteraceae bacterium]